MCRGCRPERQPVQTAAARGVTGITCSGARLPPNPIESIRDDQRVQRARASPRAELFDLLDAVREALRPGGCLIAVVPNAKGLFGAQVRFADITHELSFTPTSVAQLCAVVGLDVPIARARSHRARGAQCDPMDVLAGNPRRASVCAHRRRRGLAMAGVHAGSGVRRAKAWRRPRSMTSTVLMLGGPASGRATEHESRAQELFAAVGRASTTHEITLEQPTETRTCRDCAITRTRAASTAPGRAMSRTRARCVGAAGAFHILDHGHAQLIRSLDPERTVVTCHDVIPLLASEHVIPLDVPATRTFKLRMTQLAQARVVIAISAATRATLERYTEVPSDRIVVIPTVSIQPSRVSRRETSTARVGGRGRRGESRSASGDQGPLQEHAGVAQSFRAAAIPRRRHQARENRRAALPGRGGAR